MKTEVLKKNDMYKVFNDITLKNEIIIFGSSFMANFPFYELAHKYLLSNAIYNRSIDGLTLAEADEILENCVLKAKPSKVFYALGEKDAENEMSLTIYEDILHKTKASLPDCKIYVLSLPDVNGKYDNYNSRLKKLCEKANAVFISLNYNNSHSGIYRQLSLFFRTGRAITFSEAFQMAE
ncbi:MAG: hypothetical protein IJ366_09705 [Clostridia bacterium]|nr:hypothetical protein [Clostridia bacterium]